MPKPAFEENHRGSARALVEHLRQNPGEARADPAALAARFGLDAEFVRRALARLPEPVRMEAPRGPNRLAQGAGGILQRLDAAQERAAQDPLRFEALSLLLAIGAFVALSEAFPSASQAGPGFHISVRGGLGIAVLLAVVCAQMAVFYRRRMVRYAVYGGLIFGMGTSLPMMVWTWVQIQRNPPANAPTDLRQGVVVFTVGLAMLLMGALYGLVAAVASLAGGWMHLRREEREWEQLSRQELLERYFELQRRLDQSVAAPDEGQEWESWQIVRAIRRRPLLAAVGVGLIAGTLRAALSAAFGSGPGAAGASDALQVLAVVDSLLSYAAFGLVAFLSGRASRGAWCGLAYEAAFYATLLIPVADAGPAFATGPGLLAAVGLGLASRAIVGSLAGLGATIQRRAVRERRLMRNDGSTLVAEMLEIQWRLEEDATSVTVLVVDAAQSTAMKVGADPLDVEYSFREYQTWIAETCAGFGGRVHSVAGDGAVVAFADAPSAMASARRLQTDVARFNGALNRLPKPFRLRLGLHAGRVAGDLNDVQFTEVIDIAAHVESISPVGGVAATGAVVSILGEDGFLPLARDIDGQTVYIALVPTEA